MKAGSFYGTNNAILGLYPAIDNQVPVQLVQGQADGDGRARPGGVELRQDQHGPKQIVRVSGANHYGITDVQSPAGAEAEVNSAEPEPGREHRGHRAVGRAVAARAAR